MFFYFSLGILETTDHNTWLHDYVIESASWKGCLNLLLLAYELFTLYFKIPYEQIIYFKYIYEHKCRFFFFKMYTKNTKRMVKQQEILLFTVPVLFSKCYRLINELRGKFEKLLQLKSFCLWLLFNCIIVRLSQSANQYYIVVAVRAAKILSELVSL